MLRYSVKRWFPACGGQWLCCPDFSSSPTVGPEQRRVLNKVIVHRVLGLDQSFDRNQCSEQKGSWVEKLWGRPDNQQNSALTSEVCWQIQRLWPGSSCSSQDGRWQAPRWAPGPPPWWGRGKVSESNSKLALPQYCHGNGQVSTWGAWRNTSSGSSSHLLCNGKK